LLELLLDVVFEMGVSIEVGVEGFVKIKKNIGPLEKNA
jgi:hypothetical protein